MDITYSSWAFYIFRKPLFFLFKEVYEVAEKTLNTRIQQKHDIELNWNKAINFIPKIGEIIIYDVDENNSIPRIKIGDGINKINDLYFIGTKNQPQALKLVDEVTGKTYALSIRNGILTTSLAYKEIIIITPPAITNYYVGGTFDPYGMKIGAVTFDNEVHEITNYTYSTEPLTLNDAKFKITYTQGGEAITTNLLLTIYEEFVPERDLIDFIYETVDNGDGTYSYYLVGWKGTYLGQPSTKMVIPNHHSVVIT